MRFRVIPNRGDIPKEGQDIGYLRKDNWDDWFRYETLYVLTYFDNAGEKHNIGAVKIGQFDMEVEVGRRRPDLPNDFEELDERFFSLGQDADYYSAVWDLGPKTAEAFLKALNDIVANTELYQQALKESVTSRSLLRSVNVKTIEGQYRRIIGGGVKLSKYRFDYKGPRPVKGIGPIHLEFAVVPDSLPPTNIHVLIGRNGVGKTFLLSAMTRALVSSDSDEGEDGLFTSYDEGVFGETHESPFANVLSITFSAFDDFEIMRRRRNATKGARYTNVGLRKQEKDNKNEWGTITRGPEDLTKEFSDSAKLCARGAKTERWRRALTTLEADPLFAEAEVVALVDVSEEHVGRKARQIYRGLSSGHKIVLLSITKLVEIWRRKPLSLWMSRKPISIRHC